MIVSLLTFGGIVFWCIVAFFALVVTYEVNKAESVGLPLFWTAIAIGLTYAFTDAPVPDFTLTNIAIGAASWFAIGAVWSLGKWVHLVYQIKNYVRDEMTKHGYSMADTDADEKLREQVCRAFEPNDAVWKLSLPPKASEFHTRITSWITFWPASMLATLFGDLLAPAVEFLFGLGGKIARGLAGTFSTISKRIYES